MTIHKAQGSEANHVILIWPYFSTNSNPNTLKKENNDDFKRKLMYTAITRAKEQLDVIIDSD